MKKLTKYYFISVTILFLTSCTTTVNDYDWEWSVEMCKNKGGVRYVKTAGFNPMKCKCQNGERIFKEN